MVLWQSETAFGPIFYLSLALICAGSPLNCKSAPKSSMSFRCQSLKTRFKKTNAEHKPNMGICVRLAEVQPWGGNVHSNSAPSSCQTVAAPDSLREKTRRQWFYSPACFKICKCEVTAEAMGVWPSRRISLYSSSQDRCPLSCVLMLIILIYFFFLYLAKYTSSLTFEPIMFVRSLWYLLTSVDAGSLTLWGEMLISLFGLTYQDLDGWIIDFRLFPVCPARGVSGSWAPAPASVKDVDLYFCLWLYCFLSL